MSFIPGANVGPYRIVEQAERRGLVTTYTAYQPAHGRYVSIIAIPNIPRDHVPLLRQRQRQLELIASLRHPNLLTVLDHGEHLGVAFVVTELVEAEPLTARLGAPWPLSEVIRVLRPVAAALDYAHEHGVVHGGVRPSMVLLTPDGTPILGGFGLAVKLAPSSDDVPTLVPGQRIRPLGEQIEAGQRRDRRGLALIAYEMLTGRAVEVEAAAEERPLPPALLGSPLLTPPVERILLRGLSDEPAGRHPTATMFVDDLAASLTTRPSELTESVVAATAAEPADTGSRQRWMTIGLIIGSVALLGLIVFMSRNAGITPSISDTRATATANGATAAGSTAMESSTAGSAAGTFSDTGSPVASSGALSAGSPAADASSVTAVRTVVPGSGSTASGPVNTAVSHATPVGSSAAARFVASSRSVPAGATPEPGSAGDGRPNSLPLIVPSVSAPAGTPAGVLPAAGSTAPETGAGPNAGSATSAGPASSAGASTPPGTSAPGSTPRPVSTRIPATWRVDGDTSGRWSFDDQGRLLGHVDDGISLLLFPESYDDVDYSALVNTTTCQSTLVFRAQDPENLLFAIYIPDGLPGAGAAGGGIWLYQRVEGLDLPIKAARPSTMRPAGEPVKLRVATNGAQILVSLDDETAIQAVDTAVKSGKLGTMVYSPGGKTCETTYGDIQR